MKSAPPAASPVSSALAPGATWLAVGVTRSRRAATVSLAAVTPRSGIGTETTAVRPSRDVSTVTFPCPPVTARARSPSAWSCGPRSSSPRAVTTSSASLGAPGKARSIARCATTTGVSCGSASS